LFGAFYFNADLQSYNQRRYFSRSDKKYKFTHAVLCGTSDVCSCYYDSTGKQQGGVVRFPELGMQVPSLASRFSLTAAMECISSGYASSSFHSLFKDSTNSKIIMASVSALQDDSYTFSVKQITGFSGVTFGSVGVMVGSNFYYVGRI